MKVMRYTPSFFSGDDGEWTTVNTLEELLAIPWIHSWTRSKDFHQFSLSDDRYLMCEVEEGRHWYVVAILNADHLEAPGGSCWEKGVQCICGAHLEDIGQFKKHVSFENLFQLPEWKPVLC